MLTLLHRMRRLASQFMAKMDRMIDCDDSSSIDKIVHKARTRWGGHTDLQIELTHLRVHQQQLLFQRQGSSTSTVRARRVAVVGCGYVGSRVGAELARCGCTVAMCDAAGRKFVDSSVADALADAYECEWCFF